MKEMRPLIVLLSFFMCLETFAQVVISSVSPPANGTYSIGSALDFSFVFSAPVDVTGTPRVALNIGNQLRYANFYTKSDSKTLVFRYVIVSGYGSSNGVGVAGPIQLSGGSITSTSSVTLSFRNSFYPGILVNAPAPGILSVTPVGSPPTFLKAGDTSDFDVVFSEPVIATNSKTRLRVLVGTGSHFATYVSGSGTTTFRYRVYFPIDAYDNDGIGLSPTLEATDGILKNLNGVKVSRNFTPPNLSSWRVDARVPTVQSNTKPSDGTYYAGTFLNFALTYSRVVTVSGNPRVQINVGTPPNEVAVYADYVSGSGSSVLTFRYAVKASDIDLDGVFINQWLNFDQGSISDQVGNSANFAYWGKKIPNYGQTLVNLAGSTTPTIISISLPGPKTYIENETLDFVVNFNRTVAVTGIPRIAITTDTGPVYANYLSGSGTSALTFRYTVGLNEADSNGILLTSPINLNSGTIKDLASSANADLTFTAPNTSTIKVDALAPQLGALTTPTSGVYVPGNSLTFTFATSEPVVVTGTPSLTMIIGSKSVSATYNSSLSNSKTLAFSYPVASGDSDTDGILLVSPLSLNGGTIKDLTDHNLSELGFTIPNTTGVLVDGATGITGVTTSGAGTYKPGQSIDIFVQYAAKARVTGIPRIALTVGSQTLYATYISGNNSNTLTFRYTVTAGNLDTNGIDLISPIDLNGGAITGGTGSLVNFVLPNTTQLLIDGIDISISSLGAPTNGTYGLGQTLSFSVGTNYASTVSGIPRIPLLVGTSVRYATYASGSGTTSLVFNYSVGSTDVDSDGIAVSGTTVDLNGGAITDPFGESANLTLLTINTSGLFIDGVVPNIQAVSKPTSGTYGLGQVLGFNFTFSKPMIVSGVPRLLLNIGGVNRYATYSGGSGTNVLQFQYVIVNADTDADGITVGSTIDLNGGQLKDAAGNNLSSLTFPVLDTSGVIVNTSASIVSVTAPAAGTYGLGQNLDFSVNFSNPVFVTNTPSIGLVLGGSTVDANYVSGSGSTNLLFRYTVKDGDLDLDGISVSSVINLNSGTINDSSGYTASIFFTPPNTTAVLVKASQAKITTITPVSNGTIGLGQNINLNVTFSAPVNVNGIPSLQLLIGATTVSSTYISGSGTTTLVFRYTVSSGQNDSDGVETVGTSLFLNGGTIHDTTGTPALLTYTPALFSLLKVDTVAPVSQTVSAPPAKTYAQGDIISFQVTYSEIVSVTGIPRLTLTVGTTTQYATYVSGSGSNTLLFQYPVLSGLSDLNGITMLATLSLNGGTIIDLGNNAQTNLGFSLPTLTSVLVDSISPTISSVTPPAAQTYTTGGNLSFSMNFSEVIQVTGIPSLVLKIGTNFVNANYVSGSGSATIVFRYTVVVGDSDLGGIDTTSPLLLNGGTLKDLQGNPSNLNFTAALYSTVKVDALAPSILSVTPPADAVYKSGGTRPSLSFKINFSESVIVTGIPRLQLSIGSVTRYATYASGTNSSTLTFTYTLATTDSDLDGISVLNSNQIDLNAGSIKDSVGLNSTIDFGSVSTSKIKVVNSSVENWYDITETSSLVFTGFNVTGLTDLVGTLNLTHNASGAIYNATNFNNGTNAYLGCNSGGYFTTASKTTSPVAIVAIFRAPTNTTGQYLFYLGSATRQMVQFSSTANGGTVNFGTTGQKYASGAWSTAATTATNLWSLQLASVRGFAWTSTQKQSYQFCQMDGELAEAFFFNTLPTTTQMSDLASYIGARYGLTFP